MDIVSRSEWGARSPKSRRTIDLPTPDLYLHHTAGSEPDGPNGVLRVQNFHMDSRGWHDIAYSFVVDRTGTVYEGRGAGIAGAHTSGHNSTSHAICVLGHYDREQVPQVVVDAVGDLVAHGHTQGWWTNPYLTGGHRDVAQTSCPGLNLYARIPDINRRATSLTEANNVRRYAQAVVVPTVEFGGKNRDWDRALGAVLGATYEWAVVETDDGRTFTSLTHPGEPATIGDWAGVVGAARYDVDANPPGTRIAGEDRWDTAAVVAELLLDHPAEKIDRRGRPW